MRRKLLRACRGVPGPGVLGRGRSERQARVNFQAGVPGRQEDEPERAGARVPPHPHPDLGFREDLGG